MYANTEYVNTLDFGYVPIRKTHTEGKSQQWITLSDNGTNEAYAEIRLDYQTNQPFAVLFDKDCKQI